MKIRKVINNATGQIKCLYFCPGCGDEHAFNPAIHKYNEDSNFPTVTPSLVYSEYPRRCHSFITAGKIRFLQDCDHEGRGKQLDIPHYPEGTELIEYI